MSKISRKPPFWLLLILWLRRSGALLAGTVLIILPVAVRNGVVGGAFLPTTFQAGTNFYIGDFKVAASWFEKAAAFEPESDGVYSNLGSVYISLGDLDRASRFLDKALMLNPENVEALQNKSSRRLSPKGKI